jgi:hypothetical protein
MSPRRAVGELSRQVHPGNGHLRLLAMIDAYLDESGIHKGASMCVIAGYFAEPREWKKFESDWRSLLSAHLVKMPDFHAMDLFKKRGAFHGWGEKSYRRFVGEVLDTILRYKVFPISAGIIVDDFNSFTVEERRYMTGATVFPNGKLVGGCPRKPYFVPFQACVRKIAEYTPRQGRAQFAFGLDRDFYRYANELFRDMKLKAPLPWREKLGHSTNPLAADTPELQAADVLTYLTYIHMNGHYYPDKGWVDEPGPGLKYLLQRAKSRADFVCFDESGLQIMLNETRAILDAAGFRSPI